MVLAATDWGVGEVVLTFLWFTMFFIWIWLAISVFIDIFRSPDMGGIHKALWVLAIFIVPFLGVLAYLIVRGGKMATHNIEAAKAVAAGARAPAPGPSGERASGLGGAVVGVVPLTQGP